MSKRVWASLSDEKLETMKEWADSLGVPLSYFVGMSAWVGAKTIMRTVEPEKIMSPEQWAAIIKASQDIGLVPAAER